MLASVADAQQDDGQVAGDGVAPQAGLPAPVLHEHAGVGAQRGMGVEDRAGQAPVELRVRLAGVDLAQHHLGVGPGQLEDAVGEAPVLVFLDQAQGGIAAVADAVDQVHAGRLLRAPGVIRQRMATTGSSTEPWLPDSATPSSIARGAAAVRPRPMKRARSVS